MSQLVNQGFIGQDFIWWIGQVADDSVWRENALSGKYESPESIPGWGYRYKVRIFGLQDLGEGVVESKDLPWANVMYPTTAGAYLQNSGQTPMIRQGAIVFGFFVDGVERQEPIITGVFGNNSQTELATTIGDNRVTNTTATGKRICVSGYSAERERAKPAPGTALNKYGLPSDRPITEEQQKDINSARAEAEAKNLSPEATERLIKKRVQFGVAARVKEANSPRAFAS